LIQGYDLSSHVADKNTLYNLKAGASLVFFI
jgi:hypothetical protein